MKLLINVDAQPLRITGNSIEEITETWEYLAQRGAELGCNVNAKSLHMTEQERESLRLITNVPASMEQLLNLGGWAECDPNSHDEEYLPMPTLFDDAPPIANYEGAGGFTSQFELDRTPIGPALPLPKLY